MYNGQTVSLKKILWKVMNHPLARDLSYEDAAMYAIEAIELIGAPLSYVNKVTPSPISIVDYKAALPMDLITIRGIKLISEGCEIALKHTTDIYTLESDCGQEKNRNDRFQNYTYTVQMGVITTSFEEGEIVVSYVALPLDDEGYPLIANDVKNRLAIENYILYSFLSPLNDIGKVTDKAFFKISQNKDWYMGAAQSSLQLQGMDHLESTMNAINRLIINNNSHRNFYNNLGDREYINNII